MSTFARGTQDCTKDDLWTLLWIIAHSDENTTQVAEQELWKYDLSDEYSVYLTELTLNPKCGLPVRILAVKKLKEYVKAHWNPMARDFTAPEIKTQNKTKIKKLLLIGLSESNREVGETVADIIAIIVPWEWPENWPEMLDMLLHCIYEISDFNMIGALRVLDRVRLSDAAVPNISLVILPTITRIFERVDIYSTDVIFPAVSILSNIVHDTAQPGSTDFIRSKLQPTILPFFATSICIWKDQKNCTNDLKLNIMRCVSSLVEILPRCIKDPLPEFLAVVLETFADCAKNYRAGAMDRDSQDLVRGLFAFINSLMFEAGTRVPNIPEFQILDDEWFYMIDSFVRLELLQHVFIFIECTNDDYQLWKRDVKQFVSGFFQENELVTPVEEGSRRNATNFLIKVAKHARQPVRDVLIDMIMKPVNPQDVSQAASDPSANQYWWNEREALLLAFCLMKDNIMERLGAGTPCFDIMAYLNNAVLAHLTDSGSHPLLVARCFYFCGLYAAEMSIEMLTKCLKATILSLKTNRPATVRVAAAQAVYRWFEHYAAMGRKSGKEVCSQIPALYEGLYSVAEDFSYGDILTFVLKSIASILPYDEASTASVASRVSSLMVKALLTFWRKYSLSQWLIVFEQLMRNPGCVQSLQQSLITILVCMMTTKLEHTSPGKEIEDIIEILLQHSPLPLSDLFVDILFPAVCEYIVGTDHSWTPKWVLRVIGAYLSAPPQQLIDLRDKDGKNGVQHILRSMIYVLNLDVGHEVIQEIYETVIVLLKQMGFNLKENVGELLKALLNTIQHENFALIRFKFLVVYAYLLNAKFDSVFNYLAIEKSLSGQQDPFKYVIYEGFCKEYNSFDKKDRKVIKLAFDKIRAHGLKNKYSRLHQLMIQETEDGVQITVPLFSKISKLTK